MSPLRSLFMLTTHFVAGLYSLYEHPSEIQKYFTSNNISDGEILFNSHGEILGSIGIINDGKVGAIAFRGSETLDDWIHDFNIKQTDYYVGKVSIGFLKEYQHVKEHISNWINNHIYIQNYILTGHSLGASLATLSAAHIYTEFGITPSVYLFASPKVGNIEFANWYSSNIPNTYMFYLAGDVAPNFPTVNLGCYKHVAYPHYILNYDPVQYTFNGLHYGKCSLHKYHSIYNFLLYTEWTKQIKFRVYKKLV